MRFAALFPGQLSEKPGMGGALAARHDFCAAFFDEVSRRSGLELVEGSLAGNGDGRTRVVEAGVGETGDG